MFDYWRERRSLRQEIALLDKRRATSGTSAQTWPPDPIWYEIQIHKRRLEYLETDRLIDKACQLGVEIPDDDGLWIDHVEHVHPDDDISRYLSEFGKARVSKLIREEKRKSIEWWFKIIIPLVTALTGLVGTIIGVLSVLKK